MIKARKPGLASENPLTRLSVTAQNKSKKQLVAEIDDLQRRIVELETTQTEDGRTEELQKESKRVQRAEKKLRQSEERFKRLAKKLRTTQEYFETIL